jgi:DNA polymerase-3 subunit delta'
MSWEEIEGHDQIANRFSSAEAAGRIAGSYLFIGQEGIGKATFAKSLTMALACEDSENSLTACRKCNSCIQALAGTHPDIDIVQKPAERTTIPLESLIGSPDQRLRAGLCWRLLLRPQLASRKFAILLDADHLSEEAANCLLKTLEEPPPGAVIILVGTTLERQLPTIRSRCQVIRFSPLADDIIKHVIQREQQQNGQDLTDSTLNEIARIAQGSLSKARLFLDEELTSFRTKLFKMLSEKPLRGVDLTRETIGIVEAVGKEPSLRRTRLRLVLDLSIGFFRTKLHVIHGVSCPADDILESTIHAWSASPEEITQCLEHSLDARQGVDRNANLGILVDAWTAKLERA